MSPPAMTFSFTGPVSTVTGGMRSLKMVRQIHTRSRTGVSRGRPNIMARRE